MTKKFGLAVVLVLVMGASSYASPVSENGKLKVTGLQLANECGDPVQLRGVSTHGVQWFGYCYSDSMLDYTANTMKADVFRIAMYVEQSGYVSNPSYYTSYVDTLVDKIGARGMYALIDWHVLYVAGQSSGDPNYNIVAARTFWEHEATVHKDKNFVIYEICNEPSPNRYTVTWDMVKTYANDIIPRIRAIDPDAVIVVGTPNWSQLGSEVVSSPLSYANIMYAFHFYAGSHSTGMLTPYVGSLPIFCSEWGVSDSSGDGGDNYPNAQSFIDIMGGANTAGVKISWATWSLADNGDTSSLLSQPTPGGTPAPCSGGPIYLSAAGSFVKNNIMTPGKTFVLCMATATPTPTITGTPPTATNSPTITETHTITQTHTITPTHTVSPTFTATPTYVAQIDFKESFTYPNPSKGDKISFRYVHKGRVDKVKIRVFSYSDRKIAEVEETVSSYGEPYPPLDIDWTPPWKLGNGLYYYIIELTGMDQIIARKTGTFIVLRQLE